MNHTYDSLRELALQVQQGLATDAHEVLKDALKEAGVLNIYALDCPTPPEHQRKIEDEWVARWARLAATRNDDVASHHRGWSTLRIEIRRAGGTWSHSEQKRRELAEPCPKFSCGAKAGERCKERYEEIRRKGLGQEPLWIRRCHIGRVDRALARWKGCEVPGEPTLLGCSTSPRFV